LLEGNRPASAAIADCTIASACDTVVPSDSRATMWTQPASRLIRAFPGASRRGWRESGSQS
jgi:hypothetical protein